MGDIVIDNDQFKVCMVKKSKYYYKEVGFWSGLIVLTLLLAVGAIYVGQYLAKIFNVNDIFIFVILLLYACLTLAITYAVTNKNSSHYILTFIRNFIALHGVAVVFVGALAIDMICLSAIPVELAIILGQVIFNITGNYGMAFIGAIIVFIGSIPVNLSAFQCFKIEEYTEGWFVKSISWVKLGDVTFGDVNDEI